MYGEHSENRYITYIHHTHTSHEHTCTPGCLHHRCVHISVRADCSKGPPYYSKWGVCTGLSTTMSQSTFRCGPDLQLSCTPEGGCETMHVLERGRDNWAQADPWPGMLRRTCGILCMGLWWRCGHSRAHLKLSYLLLGTEEG